MKKKLLAVLLAGVLTVGTASVPQVALTAQAETTTVEDAEIDLPKSEDGNWYYYPTDDGISVRGYLGDDTNVIIPKEIDGKKVTEISLYNKICKAGNKITSITIPDGVTVYDCIMPNLKEVIFSEGAETIIYDFSLSMCSGLTSVKIPANVTQIKEGAFSGCVSLKEIEVDPNNQNYTSEDGILFSKDKSVLMKYPAAKANTAYAIPNGTTSVEGMAFYGCVNLENLTFPNGITKVVISGCSNLKKLTIPDSVKDIRIDDCTNLTDFVIPESVTGIYVSECPKLDFGDYTVPEGATNVYLSGVILSSINASDSVEHLTLDQYNQNLKAINVSENNAYYSSVDGVLYNKDKTELIIYPARKKGTTFEIPATVEKVWDSFTSTKYLKEITVSSNNENFIAENGVLYNKAKTELVAYPGGKEDSVFVLPDDYTPEIYEDLDYIVNYNLYELRYNEFLEEIQVDEDNPYFTCENGVLYNKDKTEMVVYPAGKKDETFEIPETVKIPAYTFSKYLKEITVNKNNPYFVAEDGVLFNLDKTFLVYYPAGKEDTKYVVPEGVQYVTISGCDNLTSLVLPDSIHCDEGAYIGNCKNLTEITMPKGMVFHHPALDLAGCTSLKTVHFKGTVADWSDIGYVVGKIYTTPDCFRGCEIICEDGIINDPRAPYETYKVDETIDSDDTSSSSSSSGNSGGSTTENTAKTVEYTDEKTGIKAIADEGVLPDGAELVVTPVTSETSDSKFTYDISFKDTDGKEVQPKGEVTVKVPVPEKFKDAEKVYVYRAETDGTYTDMKAEIKDGFVVFTTNHFSKYIVTTEVLTKTETPAPETPDTTPADTTPSTTNPPTGVAVGLVPVILAGAVVIVSAKKRK